MHATNDLQKRVALLRSPVHPDRLQAWALELDPRLQLESFNRRIETLLLIHRNGLRPRGDGQLNARWTVRFVQISGVEIAGNNAAVSNFLYKQFQSRGLQKLWAPVTDGEGLDWLRPYDLRHASRLSCARSQRLGRTCQSALISCVDMTPTRDQILAASAGWVAVVLNVIPGLGAGYLYQRRWKAYWITSALATAWFIAGALLGQSGDALAETQNQLVGLIGLLALAAVTATEAGLAVKRVRQNG